MYQYDSKDKAEAEKSKRTTASTDKDYTHGWMRTPVQTIASPMQMRFMPRCNYDGPQPLQMKARDQQEGYAATSDKPNNTGIPLQMKEKFESLSGFSFDDVKVHYNSEKPARVQALAYTQGNQVYVAAGQEKHLGHELGHVVQQKRQTIQGTKKSNGFTINDDYMFETEADMMAQGVGRKYGGNPAPASPIIQRRKIQCGITGSTHIISVEASEIDDQAIMDAGYYMFVGAGDEVEIETNDYYMSRRGPNQEVYRFQDSQQQKAGYQWFRVKRINGEPVGGNLFIRNDTFVSQPFTGSQSSEGLRTRVSPDKMREHRIAAGIMASAQAVKTPEIVTSAIGEIENPNDPHARILCMKIWHVMVEKMEEQGATDPETRERVIRILEDAIGPQLLQDCTRYDEEKSVRKMAWALFTGTLMKSDRKAAIQYITRCLYHEKGFSQTYESVVSGVEQLAMGSNEINIDNIVVKIVDNPTNTNIWTKASMPGQPKSLRKQLTGENFDASKVSATFAEYATDNQSTMWDSVFFQVISKINEIQGAGFNVLLKDIRIQDEVFGCMQRIVGDAFTLKKEALQGAIDRLLSYLQDN